MALLETQNIPLITITFTGRWYVNVAMATKDCAEASHSHSLTLLMRYNVKMITGASEGVR